MANYLNQKPSFAAFEAAIYLTLNGQVYDDALLGTLLADYTINTYPNVDFLSSRSDIKSESI